MSTARRKAWENLSTLAVNKLIAEGLISLDGAAGSTGTWNGELNGVPSRIVFDEIAGAHVSVSVTYGVDDGPHRLGRVAFMWQSTLAAASVNIERQAGKWLETPSNVERGGPDFFARPDIVASLSAINVEPNGFAKSGATSP